MLGTSHPKTLHLIQEDLKPLLKSCRNIISHKHKELFLSYFVFGLPWNLWHKSTNNSHFFLGFEAETLCYAGFRYVMVTESYFSVHMKSHMKELFSFLPMTYWNATVFFFVSFTEQNPNHDSMKSGGMNTEETWKCFNYKLQKTSQCTLLLV